MDRSRDLHCFTAGVRVTLMLFLLIFAGCSVAGRRHDRIPPEGVRAALRNIEPIQGEQFSSSEPVSVEEAAPGIAEDVRDEQQTPASLDLTLADVRAAALANNLDLQVELLNPSIVQEGVPFEEGRFDAIMGVAINRVHLDTPGITLPGVPPTPLPQFDSRSYEPELILPSRTGGALTVGRLLSKDENQGSAALHESDWRFSISQPLLRNAGLRINTAPIRIAKYTTLQVDAETRLSVIGVLAAADRQYWRVWAARQELDIRRQQYDLALQQLVDVRKFVAAEAKPEFEITRADAGLAQRVNAIIVAEANLSISVRELKRIMNRSDIPIDSSTVLELTTDPQPVGLELDQAALAEMAIQNRPEMGIQDYQLAIDSINVDVARNSRWPLATVDASSRLNGIGSGFGQANDILRSGRFADYSVGFNVAFPLPNQTARASHRQSRLQRAQTAAIRERLQLQIRQEVFDAITLFEQSWRLILAARNTVRFATGELDAERKLFEAGEQNRTTTEVLNALARLGDAQSTEVRAIAAYQISLVDVAFSTGTLLGYGRVRWDVNPACRYVTDRAEMPSTADDRNGRPFTTPDRSMEPLPPPDPRLPRAQ